MLRKAKEVLANLIQGMRQVRPPIRRILFAASALLLSAWIGLRYANDIFIFITPILLWMYSILVCFTSLYPENPPPLFDFKPNRIWLGLLALLTAALLLRTFSLTHLPEGFHPDESGSVEFAVLHIPNQDKNNLTINPFRTGSDSQPILYSYILRGSMALFDDSIYGVRLSSVLAGTLAIAAVFLLANELAGRKSAWIAAILMAVYHYHIHWSRIALSNIWTTLFLPLAAGLFLRGWRRDSQVGALLAGVCLGASIYFYTGGYVIVLLMGFLILQTWVKTKDRQRLMIYTGNMLMTAATVAAPMIAFAVKQPADFFDRVNTIYGWSREAVDLTLGTSASFFDYFIFQMTHSFGAYNIFTDVTGFYAPQIPFLIGISSMLFLVGIYFAFRQKVHFPLVWILLVTIFGGVLLAGTPSSSHFVPSIPAICILVALPLGWILETKRAHWAYVLLAGIIITDLVFYFVIYAASPSFDFSLPFP